MKWLSLDQQLAWERLYGSYLSLYFCENISIEKQDKIVIKLTDRAKAIVYLIKNDSIDIKSRDEYMKRVLEFVVDSYAYYDKSRFSDLYVGAQECFKYGKKQYTNILWRHAIYLTLLMQDWRYCITMMNSHVGATYLI